MGVEEIKKVIITLDEEFDMDAAKQNGFTILKGTNWLDYSDQPMKLDDVAHAEADAREYAERKQMQTTVSPTNGISVTWENPDSDLAKAYQKRVDEYLEKLRAEK